MREDRYDAVLKSSDEMQYWVDNLLKMGKIDGMRGGIAVIYNCNSVRIGSINPNSI